MGIKKFKPTTQSRRWMSGSDFSEITKNKPQKSLIIPLKKTGGRNNYGRITTRHIGGGHKQMLRIIDFKRNLFEVPAKVIAIEYDPNRSARIALVEYADIVGNHPAEAGSRYKVNPIRNSNVVGSSAEFISKNKREVSNGVKKYIIAPLDLKVGDEIISSNDKNAEIKTGNCLLLRYIPSGTLIHNIELVRGKGGQIIRSAGSYGQIMSKQENFAHIKLPSGEVRRISLDCHASVGQVGNVEHEAISIGKAGRTRWLGIRPTVRGLAMNPVDHPHGGGEGKSGQGNPHPVTPWGKPTKGYKTRRPHKYSDKFIINKRK